MAATLPSTSTWFGRTARNGLVQADPLGVMEYRNKINADDVKIIAEVASMHFRWLGGAKPVGEIARAAVVASADAVSLSHPDEDIVLAMVARCAPRCRTLRLCWRAVRTMTTHTGCWRRRMAHSSVRAWRSAAGAGRIDVERVRAEGGEGGQAGGDGRCRTGDGGRARLLGARLLPRVLRHPTAPKVRQDHRPAAVADDAAQRQAAHGDSHGDLHRSIRAAHTVRRK